MKTQSLGAPVINLLPLDSGGPPPTRKPRFQQVYESKTQAQAREHPSDRANPKQPEFESRIKPDAPHTWAGSRQTNKHNPSSPLAMVTATTPLSASSTRWVGSGHNTELETIWSLLRRFKKRLHKKLGIHKQQTNQTGFTFESEHLRDVTFVLAIHDDTLTLKIQTPSRAIHETIQQELTGLAKAFEEQGIKDINIQLS